MAAAPVDTVATIGRTYTLDATDKCTPWFDPGDLSSIALLTLEFNGAWNGTLSFQTAAMSDGVLTTADPVTATNLNGGSTATSSTGGASADEHWRVDLAGGSFVRAYATLVTAGSVDVTIHVTRG